MTFDETAIAWALGALISLTIFRFIDGLEEYAGNRRYVGWKFHVVLALIWPASWLLFALMLLAVLLAAVWDIAERYKIGLNTSFKYSKVTA